MITESLPFLKINKLTQEQYDAAKTAGNINKNEFYVTPESEAKSSVFIATYGITTNAEIEAACQAGKVVICKRDSNKFMYLSYRPTTKQHYFHGASSSGHTSIISCVNNNWTETNWRPLPSVTADDAGKILMVNDSGSWAASVIKPTIIATTLTASNWDSTSKTYSFEAEYPYATYDLEIALNSTATTAQAEAFNGAQIVGSATSNVVKAYGIVPTVDIPVIIKVVRK